MPREPPYFDAPYHSTDLNLEIGTGVTVVPAPITNPHRKSDGNERLIYFFEFSFFLLQRIFRSISCEFIELASNCTAMYIILSSNNLSTTVVNFYC